MKKFLFTLALLLAPLGAFAADDGFYSEDPLIRARIAAMMDDVIRLMTTPGGGFVSEDPAVRAKVLAMTSQTQPQTIYVFIPYSVPTYVVPSDNSETKQRELKKPAPEIDYVLAKEKIRERFLDLCTNYDFAKAPWFIELKWGTRQDLAMMAADRYTEELKLDKTDIEAWKVIRDRMRQIGTEVNDEATL